MPGFLAEVLTWPKNYYNAVAVETAVNMGIPPTSLLSDKQPSESWSRADKKLAVAWTLLQRETCSRCGQPIWICRSSDKNVSFKMKRDVCYATAEFDRNKDKKQYKDPKPGEYFFTVPYTIDDSPLPSRKAYLESIADE